MQQLNPGEHSKRLAAVRERLADWGVEGVMISSSSNRRWLSGFTGSAGWLLITADKALLVTDFRYWEQAARQAPDFELFRLKGKFEAAFPQLLTAGRVSQLGLEGRHVTLNQFELLKKLESVAWVTLESTVEAMRHVKTEAELAAIRAAAAITDMAMSQVNEIIRPGMSEGEVAWELEKIMREAGASGMAFPVIVGSGPNGALAHHRPGNRRLKVGEPIVIDMGAELDGYNSDLTRTFYLGNEPDEKFWQVYNLVLQAQTVALQTIHAGMEGKAADAIARDLIAAAGQAENFGHSLGHGVGLDVHEGPRLSHLLDDEGSPVPAGSVVTVEPGVYLPDWGGVRIEDLALVTDSGVELLSRCPKNPIIPVGTSG
ncbi:MAG: aminopeptidase P family protein [Chloroflexi bacterium]|nr:aminopeptidase P family protein [Chloroflexota bacterium]MCI0578598.1 aminopeptidase P family protein [Chloroflexota bacterium]MCI0647357.1 aminopeptidase P family protein [Chloroflexota bacterium]MCI0727817.1 aminopeptidase P family protein [Chloroflexota bacterium]